MRLFLLLALVALNMALFIWHRPEPESPEVKIDARVPGVQWLRLASEDGSLAPVAAVSSLRPVGSSAKSASERPVSKARTDPSAPSGQGTSSVCWHIGPFRGQREAKKSLESLRAKGVRVELQNRQRNQELYWVFVPPLPSMRAALAIEKGLRNNGITDIQVVASDDKRNAVSLGVFSDASTAHRRQRQIKGLGQDTEIETLHRTQQEYWLEVVPGASDARKPAPWEGIRMTYPQLQVESGECN